MKSTKRVETKYGTLNFDPAQFQVHNGMARPSKDPKHPNTRWGALLPDDVAGYLASHEWSARKGEYFAWVRAQGFEPACQVCYVMLRDINHLDLHHHAYGGILVARPHRKEYISWESRMNLVPLCRDHHIQIHRQLSKIERAEGYIEGLQYANSRQALRMIQKTYAKAPSHERLGLFLTTAPLHREPPQYAPRVHRSAARR